MFTYIFRYDRGVTKKTVDFTVDFTSATVDYFPISVHCKVQDLLKMICKKLCFCFRQFSDVAEEVQTKVCLLRLQINLFLNKSVTVTEYVYVPPSTKSCSL